MAVTSQAASFNVNSTADLDDVAPGNGVCSAFIANTCALRAAIQETNALPGGRLVREGGGARIRRRRLPSSRLAWRQLELAMQTPVLGAG